MKDRLFFSNLFCAVEYTFDSDGIEQFHTLQLTKKKNELILTNSKTFTDVNSVFSHLKSIKQEHIVLVVNNNQVLSKSINIVEPNSNKVFKNAYPTLSYNDFYIQVAYSEHDSWISIVRNSYITQLVGEYAKHDISVLEVHLGNVSISSIVEMIDYKEVFTSNAMVTIDEGKLQAIKYKQFDSYNYAVNGIKFHSKYILSLASIVDFYIKKNQHFNPNYLSDYKDKKVFNLGYKLALGLIFTMVLVNFLFFNNYNKNVNSLEQELEIKRGAKTKLKAISINLNKKRKLLSELQNSRLLSVSKYSDQIVAEIPKSVLLTEINYQPIVGRIRKGKATNFNIKEIEVKGVLHNYVEFTRWIDNIERKPWVNQLVKLSTEKDKRKKSSNFDLIIRIK